MSMIPLPEDLESITIRKKEVLSEAELEIINHKKLRQTFTRSVWQLGGINEC